MIVKKWFIFNTADQAMYMSSGFHTLEAATALCKKINESMKPQFATYMVVELSDTAK